jgi:hypothetical protein
MLNKLTKKIIFMTAAALSLNACSSNEEIHENKTSKKDSVQAVKRTTFKDRITVSEKGDLPPRMAARIKDSQRRVDSLTYAPDATVTGNNKRRVQIKNEIVEQNWKNKRKD